MDILTRLEELLLMSIYRLKEDAYGVRIKKEVLQRTGKDFTIGALYFALDQLYNKGYVSKNVGDPTPERGGKRKTYYTLTDKGISGLKSVLEIHNNLWENISDISFSTGYDNEKE